MPHLCREEWTYAQYVHSLAHQAGMSAACAGPRVGMSHLCREEWTYSRYVHSLAHRLGMSAVCAGPRVGMPHFRDPEPGSGAPGMGG
jgi:hypothetical protein